MSDNTRELRIKKFSEMISKWEWLLELMRSGGIYSTADSTAALAADIAQLKARRAKL